MKELFYRMTIRLWATLLQRGHFFLPQPLRPLESGNVLIVAPHPDDECLGAGGTALVHRAQGDPVTVAMVSDGRRSRALSGSPTERAARRRQEAERACAQLDATLLWLGLEEGRWQLEEAQETLRPLVNDADILYLPSIVDFHPEHLKVARCVASLLLAEQDARVYELGVPLTPTLTTLLVDTREVAAQAEAALAHYVSQRKAWQPLARRTAYREALYGVARCEPFWAMSGTDYTLMVEASWWDWRTTPFRGLRPRPFDDGLAYLLGEHARRHLLRAVTRHHA